MGIREMALSESKKNLTFEFDSNDFSDIGYWIRSLKYRFKTKRIFNVHISLNVSYDIRNYNSKGDVMY